MANRTPSTVTKLIGENGEFYAEADEIVLDSGGSDHLLCSLNWFTHLHTIPDQKINTANGVTTVCNQAGTVNLQVYANGRSARTWFSLKNL